MLSHAVQSFSFARRRFAALPPTSCEKPRATFGHSSPEMFEQECDGGFTGEHNTHWRSRWYRTAVPPSESVAAFGSFRNHTFALHATFHFNLVNRSVRGSLRRNFCINCSLCSRRKDLLIVFRQAPVERRRGQKEAECNPGAICLHFKAASL